MSPRQTAAWKIAAFAALLGLLVTVGGWSTRQLLKVDEKLDSRRFELDSVSRRSDHDLLVRINTRDSAMYCGSLPPDKRPGCT